MWYTEKITITLPAKEKKMGLTRPKAKQLEQKPKLKDPMFYMDMVKSGIRILACYMLLIGQIEMAAITLAIGEVAGIGKRIM